MSVQPNEALKAARERVVELEAEVEKLRKRSPRTKIEGVECECERSEAMPFVGSPLRVRACLYDDRGFRWSVTSSDDHELVRMQMPDIRSSINRLDMSPDEAEVLASKLLWCARAARGEDV
jgi:hypothetical protein